ncbi:12805_t:CDS:2, partial [Gigaspora rosea]
MAEEMNGPKVGTEDNGLRVVDVNSRVAVVKREREAFMCHTKNAQGILRSAVNLGVCHQNGINAITNK